MRYCPNCKNPVEFFFYLTHYGSDSLMAHPSQKKRIHKREHACFHCAGKFWISYDPARLKQTAVRYSWILGIPGLSALLCARVVFRWEYLPSVVFTLTVLLLILPVAWAYVKYEAADFSRTAD